MNGMTAQVLPSDRLRIETSTATEPFWRAAKEGRLTACACAACGVFRMPPTPFCPECLSPDARWPELSGEGVVYSFAVVHGFPGIPDITLIPAVVELPDAPGARLVTNVIDVDPDRVSIGARLKVAFVPASDGWRLPVFRVVDETS